MVQVLEQKVLEQASPVVVQGNVCGFSHDLYLVQQYPQPEFLGNACQRLPAFGQAPGDIHDGAILRREDLYSSLITEWRRARDAGAPLSASPEAVDEIYFRTGDASIMYRSVT